MSLNMVNSGVIKHREVQLIFINAVIFVFLSIFYSGFLTPSNLNSMAMAFTYDLVVALGVTYVLIHGGLDLSVGSMVALTNVVITLLLSQYGFSVPMAILLGLALSGGIGAINGLFITLFRINSFIVTLATLAIARGAARVLTAGYFVTDLPESFLLIGQGEIFGIPAPVILSLLLVAGFDFLVRHWNPLHRAFFVGTQPDNAQLVGISVSRVIFVSYVISGLFAGISAIFMSSHIGIGYSQFATGMELRTLAAAVVGGADFSGGKGSIWGTFLGVLLLALVGNAFVHMGVSIYWQQVVNALILIIAIAVAAVSER